MVVQIRLHWVVLMRVALETVVVIGGVVAISMWLGADEGGAEFVVTLLWWSALAMVARMMWRLLGWHLTRITITPARLIKASGIISTKIQTIPLSKITDLSYNLDPNGRLLGYGEFVLETEGDHKSDLEKIKYVPKPDRLYILLCDSIFGGAPKPAADD